MIFWICAETLKLNIYTAPETWRTWYEMESWFLQSKHKVSWDVALSPLVKPSTDPPYSSSLSTILCSGWFLCPSTKISSHRSTFQVWAGAPGPTVLRITSPVVPLTNSAGSLCKIRAQSGQPSGRHENSALLCFTQQKMGGFCTCNRSTPLF